MSLDLLFLICNYGVIPAWLLLALAPKSAITQQVVHRIWIPMLLGLVYLSLFVTGPAAPEGGDFFSLAGVMTLFTNPQMMLVGWVHYLAFDLFVGAWEVRDAQRRGISHLWVVPCLFFTLMLGPIGFLAYLTLRLVLLGEKGLDEVA
ncbi:MAG: hypothetical protein ACI8W3_001764 [Myxococcota bacterium]|jgi:hypothetical protein